MKNCFKILDHALARRKQNKDTVLLVVGAEGVGKSYFILHMMDYLNAKISDLHLNAQDFLVGISTLKKDSVIVCDEGGDALDSRRTMSTINVDITKAYKVLRGLRSISIFATPELFSLDKYITYHRAHGLFYIYKTGKYVFYSGNTLKKTILTDYNQKRKRVPILNIRNSGYIPMYKGKLLADYEPLKNKKMKELQGVLSVKYGGAKAKALSKKDLILSLRSMGKSEQKIADIVGTSASYVHQVVRVPTNNV